MSDIFSVVYLGKSSIADCHYAGSQDLGYIPGRNCDHNEFAMLIFRRFSLP